MERDFRNWDWDLIGSTLQVTVGTKKGYNEQSALHCQSNNIAHVFALILQEKDAPLSQPV